MIPRTLMINSGLLHAYYYKRVAGTILEVLSVSRFIDHLRGVDRSSTDDFVMINEYGKVLLNICGELSSDIEDDILKSLDLHEFIEIASGAYGIVDTLVAEIVTVEDYGLVAGNEGTVVVVIGGESVCKKKLTHLT